MILNTLSRNVTNKNMFSECVLISVFQDEIAKKIFIMRSYIDKNFEWTNT